MTHFVRLALPESASSIRAEVADSFFRRFFGLAGRSALPPGQGLLLSPCNGVHTMFMRFAIDAFFLDGDLRILKIAENLRPWTGLALCPGARFCLELPAGESKRWNLAPGMKLIATEK